MSLSHGELKYVDVESITLDRDNPRIRKWVEMYDDVTEDRLRFALLAESSDESQGNTTTVDKLKNSIKTNGSIVQPVLLNRKPSGALICIEGNTRVRLYIDFKKQEPNDERWNKIPAIIYDDLTQAEIEAIRLQVHLVGPRQWEPYSKAKYLAHLRNEQHLPYSVIIDYAGGREREIDELITAYEEMEEYYRAILPDDGAFDTKRFTGFVELQAAGIKKAIADAGFDLHDFSKWIHTKRLRRLEDVRQLQRILKDPQARKVFLAQDSRKALEQLQRPDIQQSLLDADLIQLVRAFAERVRRVQLHEIQAMRGEDTLAELLDARDSIKFLISLLKNPDLQQSDDE